MEVNNEEVLKAGQRYASLKLNLFKQVGKPDFLSYSYETLITLLENEVAELKAAWVMGEGTMEMCLEAGDVINFASMICYKGEQQG